MTTTVTIDRLGHLGDGIAPGPVYVPRALPGETVSGELEGERLDAPRILEPSSERVAAPCPHYRRCGGCALQHARDSFVADWRENVVVQALSAQGLSTPFRPPHVSPLAARRRAVFSGRRTKKGAIVGFFGRASEDLTAVPDCAVISDGLRGALTLLERLTVVGGSRKSTVRFAVTDTETGLDVAVSGGKPLDAALLGVLAQMGTEPGLARMTWDGEPVLQAQPPQLHFGGILVSPPPGTFLQATADGENALTAAVQEATHGAARIVDLFAGCGTFALPLAKSVPVHAVESDAAALQALDQAWRGAKGVRSVTTEERDLFRRPLLVDELARYDAVVIDPPRAGAEAQMQEIAKSSLGKVAAVSCNPVTFARDAAILAEDGFSIDWLQIIDQFRWSAHMEIVASLSRG